MAARLSFVTIEPMLSEGFPPWGQIRAQAQLVPGVGLEPTRACTHRCLSWATWRLLGSVECRSVLRSRGRRCIPSAECQP